MVAAHALRRLPAQQAAGLRQEVLRRVLGAQPHLDRVAAGSKRAAPRPAPAAAARRAATRSCHSTRSTPVSASVTGCSTCRRVFISMNQKCAARASSRNSTVPAPT